MISKIIRTMRKKANLSQKELSKMCNIANTTLSGYESNYR
ncbi:MAG: helix-turn-helix domain-containing protein, partial [Malacoplasma sp.]|nr:helix-turn-helix domain-containing protein [Malacoplasma sp.]